MQVKTNYSFYPDKIVTHSPTRASISRQWCWGVWVLALIVAFLVQASTVDVLPHMHQDETQIIDYGRLVFNPQSNWSVTWLMDESKPLLIWSYLGPVIAEVSYQIGGPSGVGPRISALVAGLAAATMALGWLLARRVPLYAAFGLSLSFLLDPLFVLSQRMARIDSWVVTLCLAACWLLCTSAEKRNGQVWKRIMLAGALAATAALMWPSAVFLYPLVALELVYFLQSRKANGDSLTKLSKQILLFIAGVILTVILLLIPIWKDLFVIFGETTAMVSHNVEQSRSFIERISGLFNFGLWLKLIKTFIKTFSPLLPLLALIGALYQREKGLVFVTLISLAMMFATLVYEFRVLYLLPYFLALAGGIFLKFDTKSSNHTLQQIGIGMLMILVFWSAGISLLVRTALAFNGKAERDRSIMLNAAINSIGSGKQKVFLSYIYEFYYAGRALDWEMYIPYIQYDYTSTEGWIRERDYQPKDKFLHLLSQMDYAVFPQGAVTKELAGQLSQSGLQFRSTIIVSGECTNNSKTQLSINLIHMLWFLRGTERYGPYLLYARKNKTTTAVHKPSYGELD